MLLKIIISLLTFATVSFFILTVHRMTLEYNESGVSFDGQTTYNSDAILVYGTITLIFFIVTILTILIRKRRTLTSET